MQMMFGKSLLSAILRRLENAAGTRLLSLGMRFRLRHRVGRLNATRGLVVDYAQKMRESHALLARLREEFPEAGRRTDLLSLAEADRRAAILRGCIRAAAGLSSQQTENETIDELWAEVAFLTRHARDLKPYFEALRARRVLYAGQSYYHNWYLSRALRKLGWRADVLNWDPDPGSQVFYHGEDIHFTGDTPYDLARDLGYYLESLYHYDLVHFANAHGIRFSSPLRAYFERRRGAGAEIHLLRQLGKKICYTNNGCLDGVLQSSFAKWGPDSVCAICPWRGVDTICSDWRNRVWGEFRNDVTDYQCLLGGNRADFNLAPTVHETPEAFCLDKDIWDPGLQIPDQWRLEPVSKGTIRLYHAVGNREARTRKDGINIKSTHVYLPLIEKLRSEGYHLDLISPNNVPNKDVRFLQMQADIVLEMLTFGWFGANVREAMMLGKPVVCYIRPEWLDSLRAEIPAYADELPIISATPDTVEAVLRDLIGNPEKCKEIGRKSREFAIKWHSKEAAAHRFDTIYSELLQGNPLLVERYV